MFQVISPAHSSLQMRSRPELVSQMCLSRFVPVFQEQEAAKTEEGLSKESGSDFSGLRGCFSEFQAPKIPSDKL